MDTFQSRFKISSYLFFAIKHGCSFKVRVSEQMPITSPLVQFKPGNRMHGDCYLDTCWITKILHMLIEAQYSVDNNEEDESAAILTDLRRLLEGLNIADEELKNGDQEDTDIMMYQDE